jgi:hypothetical protein
VTLFLRPVSPSAQSSRELVLTMTDATARPIPIVSPTTALHPTCASLTVLILPSILTACAQQTLNAVPLTVTSPQQLVNPLASSSN